MLDNGYKIIYVLYISTNAIERVKQRLGERASKVQWIVSDITEFEPPVEFNICYDRAAFHFLRTENKIYKYFFITEDAIKKRWLLNTWYIFREWSNKMQGFKNQAKLRSINVSKF